MTVYFIKPVGMDGPIKVGCSFSPERRRRALDTWSPFALEIIAEIEGDYDLEQRFHALFVETHQRREWFGASKRIAATVAAINDGSFDIATLPAPLNVCRMNNKGKGSRAKQWSPARLFSIAYQMRAHALTRRGMPWAEYCAGPRFSHFGYSESEYAHLHPRYDDLIAHVRACEAFADALTAKYGHGKMKPVRWIGPFPDASPTNAQSAEAA